MLDSTPVFEALSIPELLDAIQVYLTLHDIVQCAAVSKPFQALFAPLLWETITIKTRHQHVAFTTVPEVQDALVRNAPHIRIIYLRTCKSLEPFLRVDPAHLKLLHTVAFPWALKTHDRNYYYKDMDEDYQPSFASSVYTLPLSTPQDAGQSRQERRPRSTYSAIDRVFAQQDWLRAEGMFPAREQAVGTQLRHLQRFQELQRRQAEERKRAAQGALAFASATIATPPGTPTASSSSSSNVSASTTTSTATMTTQQRMANMLERQRQLQQVQNIQTNRQRLLQVHLQQQLQQQQAQQQQAQQQTQQTPPLQPPLQQQPILSNQQQLQLQQLQNQIQQGMQAQQAHGTLHFQVLQQQSRQNAQHGLQHHSLQLRTPQIILAANQQMAAQAHATAQTAGLIQQLVILENREQASLLFEANRRGLQGPRVNNQQVMQALETQQAALLESQRLVHQQLPWKDYSPHRQVVLRAHEMALINAERQFVYFHGIVHQHKILSPQEHRDAQTQVDQYLPQLVSLQQTQRGIAQSEGQQQQQVEPTLGPANFQEQVNQLTLVRAMERLQLCIEVLPRAQAHLDSIESIPAQPWFVDNAEDERWLVRFMTRFSGLKAFGSGNLILSNKEVWDSMGRLWSDMRVLSLVLFKYATGPPPQRHLELAALLDRCPPRLESLQLSFSAQDMFLHPSTHEFTRINNDAGPAGPGSVALEDIPTLRRVYIEGHIGKKDYLQDAETWIQFLCRCPNLQSLALGSCTWQVTRLVAAKVKDYWPQLEEFATSPIRQTAHDPQLDQSIAMLLNAACWGSTSVDNDDDEEMVSTDPVTDTLILRRRGMKKVRFDQLIFNSQSPTLQSLFRLSHSLTHLSMRDCQFSGGSASDTLLRLLRACDRLVEVDLLPSGSYYRSYLLPLNAQQFVKLFSLNTPWPSTRTLKVFRVAIDGCGQTPLAPGATAISIFTSTGSSSVAAPLPSSLLHSSGVVDPSFMSASSSSSLPSSSSVPMQSPLEVLYELQRQVCQILGSFTALEELSLGVHCERDQLCGLLPHLFQQTLCLEMMLESGLNLMGGLKQLRILNVSRMAHQIGVTELEWMQAHWPRLHTVQGLLRVANWSHRQAGAGQHAMNTSVSTAMVTEEKERNEEAEESEKRVLEWAEKNFSWLVFT